MYKKPMYTALLEKVVWRREEKSQALSTAIVNRVSRPSLIPFASDASMSIPTQSGYFPSPRSTVQSGFLQARTTRAPEH
jgi:hypothetical protein